MRQKKLQEEAAERRVVLADNLSCLNRDRHMITVCELKAHDGMGDPRRAPSRDEDINVLKLPEIVAPGLPQRLIVGFRAIVEVAQIVDRD